MPVQRVQSVLQSFCVGGKHGTPCAVLEPLRREDSRGAQKVMEKQERDSTKERAVCGCEGIVKEKIDGCLVQSMRKMLGQGDIGG